MSKRRRRHTARYETSHLHPRSYILYLVPGHRQTQKLYLHQSCRWTSDQSWRKPRTSTNVPVTLVLNTRRQRGRLCKAPSFRQVIPGSIGSIMFSNYSKISSSDLSGATEGSVLADPSSDISHGGDGH
jgi:hypothetical protein